MRMLWTHPLTTSMNPSNFSKIASYQNCGLAQGSEFSIRRKVVWSEHSIDKQWRWLCWNAVSQSTDANAQSMRCRVGCTLSLLHPSELNDIWSYIWGSTQFSSSKAYKCLTGHSQAEPIFKLLWKTCCQRKHKIFFWLALRDRLSTRNMIKRRGMFLECYQCVLCQNPPEESVMHLLFYCPFAKDY